MDLTSPNLNLPYLAPAQAQKHVTHNEALRYLDAVVQLSVLSVIDVPPATSPQNGDRFIMGLTPQGIFEAQANNIAAFQDGAWAFFVPKAGWRAYVEDVSELQVFEAGIWQSPSSSIETADKLGINTSADNLNRLAVKSPNTLLDNEGADHRLKVNKAADADTASLLFQSGYAGYAELGLTGDKDFHLRISADGNVFEDSLVAHAENGAVSFPKGINPSQMTSVVTMSGGADAFYGLPNLSSVFYGRSGITLFQDRMYFSSFYVDRPSEFRGGFVAQYADSTVQGSVIRAGIYALGQAAGNHWSLGERIVDLGAQSADSAGHKDFEPAEFITLMPGWYAAAIGTTGANVKLRYARVLQAGTQFLLKHESSTASDVRSAGSGNFLYSNNAQAEIVNGLSEAWPNNPITDVISANLFGHLMFFPKWTMWA